MQIIQDIIQELIQADQSLAKPLFKAKFLANQIGNSVFLDWVNNELNGYQILQEARNEKVPGYRKHGARLLGSYFIGYTPYDNSPLPTVGLEDSLADFLQTTVLYDSVASLEKMAIDSDSDRIGSILSPELCSLIERAARKLNPHFKLMSARRESSSTVIVQSLTAIRSTFLDFMMKLNAEFGGVTNMDELKQQTEKITTIMNNIVINNSGDGTLINTGHNSQIDNNVSVSKGNFEKLANNLLERGVNSADIEELKEILETEKPNPSGMVFGVKTNTWITKMISKSLDGSWAISLGAAGELLADAIKLYYGWK